eukprot:TRINITY_DN4835_c0_g1_i1.p1 TRINITY_DN4835_c0_g1~~TRINITY_DN4835_c0_g1_i1.p1  ORF type:complete len:201 (+),score=71.77 TRINITY_DN4835_c0_g1_i1:53-655(+)
METESQQKQHFEAGMDLLLSSARLLESEETESLKEPIRGALKSFESLMKDYLKASQDFGLHQTALHQAGLEPGASDETGVQERFEAKLKELQIGVRRDAISSDSRLQEISKMIKEDDDDILVTKSSQSLVDPITKALIQNPVKNPHCGHVYDRDSVSSWLKSSKRDQLCPIASCPNKKPIRLNELKEDKLLKKRIEASKK